MSDSGATLPRATRRPLPQGAFTDNLWRRPNKIIDHDGDICCVCESKGVITPLSKYNPNRDTCWTHTGLKPKLQWGGVQKHRAA